MPVGDGRVARRAHGRSTMIAMALCASLVALLCAARAGAVECTASAGWGVRFDDHQAQSVPGTPGAGFTLWTQALTPAFALAADPLGVRLEAAASGRLEVGAPVPGEGLGALRRGSSAEAHAALERRFAAGARVTAEASALRSHDLLDVDHATVSTSSDAARWSAGARGTSQHLEAEWNVRGWRSDTATPTDTRSLAWAARAYLLRPATGALYIGAHERLMDRDRESLLRARAASLGLSRDIAPGLVTTLELGAVQEQIGLAQEAPRAAVALELGTPEDGRATRLRVRLAHELGPEFEAELGQRSGRASAWLRASSTVDIEGSSAPAPSVIQRAAFGAADTLAAATVLGVEASVARNLPYRDLPFERVQAARLRAWIERGLQPWLKFRAGWDLLARDASEGSPAFRRSRFELRIQASAL